MFADGCRHGEKLIRVYSAHQIAEQLVAETLLKLRTEWLKTEMQMAFLKKVWHTLDSNLQMHQIALLGMLKNKLHLAVDLLDDTVSIKTDSRTLSCNLSSNSAITKGKHVTRVEEILDKTIAELIQWRDVFDPSWYLLSRVVDDTVDWSLRAQSGNTKSAYVSHGHTFGDIIIGSGANVHLGDTYTNSHTRVFNDPFKLLAGLRKSVHDLNSMPHAHADPIKVRDFLGPRTAIPHSSIMTALIEGRTQRGVVDPMPVNPYMDPSKTAHSVKALTKGLSRMDPTTFGLLRCCGVINKVNTYEFVFEIPDGFENPRSLRGLLLGPPLSLNTRLAFARQLAKSVFYLHAAGFVHKNIRPENILVFDHSRDGTMSAFLFGFESFRGIREDTFKLGDNSPERNLYRHPSRQGNDPERPYEMKHDIYSLGMCLLEIGLWRSFVKFEEDQTLVEFLSSDIRDTKEIANTAKTRILTEVHRALSPCTGQRFRDVVAKCLTCLDDDSAWDQVDEQKIADIDVGVEFIENVLLQLQEINV